jgi:hypothetical protein
VLEDCAFRAASVSIKRASTAVLSIGGGGGVFGGAEEKKREEKKEEANILCVSALVIIEEA